MAIIWQWQRAPESRNPAPAATYGPRQKSSCENACFRARLRYPLPAVQNQRIMAPPATYGPRQTSSCENACFRARLRYPSPDVPRIEDSRLFEPRTAQDRSLIVRMLVFGPGYGTPYQTSPESKFMTDDECVFAIAQASWC